VLLTNNPARQGALARCFGAAMALMMAWLPLADIAIARTVPSVAQKPSPVAPMVSEITVQTPRGRIAATITLPKDSQRPPLILILHGYTGDRNETAVGGTPERMFQRVARVLGEKGLATLRFDFINSGHSSGQWRNTTFSGQADDVAAVLDFMTRDPRVDQRRIGLLGYSQGGLVALKVAARQPGIGAVVLWNPVLDPERTYDQLLGARTVQLGYDMYRVNDVGRVVSGSALLPAFMYEVKTTYPIADSLEYPGPILVVGGRRDSIVGPVDAYGALLARIRGARRTAVVMVNGDHGFDHAGSPVNLDEAIGYSAGFFASAFPTK
jgi:dienelactone hydrolase